MASIQIDTTELKKFVGKLGKAKSDFNKELLAFLDAAGTEFLSLVQDEIIERGTIDTGLLLHSFTKGVYDNTFKLNKGNLTLEVGTNVEYADYVNVGHWTNEKGQDMRFIPGYWEGDRFIYAPGAKTGMTLKQDWVEGSHYWDYALMAIEEILPGLMKRKLDEWLKKYFGRM
jgi:hypothetical protein